MYSFTRDITLGPVSSWPTGCRGPAGGIGRSAGLLQSRRLQHQVKDQFEETGIVKKERKIRKKKKSRRKQMMNQQLPLVVQRGSFSHGVYSTK